MLIPSQSRWNASVAGPQSVLRPLAQTPVVLFGADAPEKPKVLSRKEGVTQFLSLNDPDNANRLSMNVIRSLETAFKKAEADPDVKQIVLESTLEKIFCPGADLFSQMGTMKTRVEQMKKRFPFMPASIVHSTAFVSMLAPLRSYALAGHHLTQRIANSEKVTISKVNGYAVGGGAELAMACDYIVASTKGSFAIPEVKYGIFPDWGGTERLPQRIGKTLSRFIILEGGFMADKGIQGPATLTAEEAKQIGLVDAVFDPQSLDAELTAAMASGKFQTKVVRPTSKEELAALDVAERSKLVGTRFLEKYDRYLTATTEDLLKKELKGLYPPTIQLANRRISNGPKVSRLRLEKDLMTMFFYFAKVMQAKQRNIS